MFERISDVLHREMENIEEKYSDGKVPMTAQDLEHIDRMAHALKCIATYEAMQSAGERDWRRSRSTGRYYDEYRRY